MNTYLRLHSDQQYALTLGRRVFEMVDSAGLMLFHKEPNTAFCNGHHCGEWAWIPHTFALEEFIRTRCPGAFNDRSTFAVPSVPAWPTDCWAPAHTGSSQVEQCRTPLGHRMPP